MKTPKIRHICLIVSTIGSFALMSSTHAEVPQLPLNVSAYLEAGHCGEDGMLSDVDGKLAEFCNYMSANWQQVLDNFNAVAPTMKKKKLIIEACEALPPSDYLSFLEKVVQLSQAPGFDVKIWDPVMTPTKIKEGFLAYNYQNIRVAAVINRILATIPANDVDRPGLQEIASGQAREHFLDYNAAYNNSNVGTIALP